MAKTDFLENEILKACLGFANSIPSAGWTSYIALFTVAPSDTGGGTEVSGGSYARQATAGKFPSPSGTGSVSNSSSITFPTATASWGTIVAYGLFTAVTGGTLLRWQAVNTPKPVSSGDTVVYAASTVSLTEL
jgi:hypothetical protein